MIGTIGQQNSGIGKARRNTKVLFEEDGKTFETTISELTAGLSIVYVNTVDDLPAPVSEKIILEQNTGYVILNQIVTSDRIIFPAGYRGFIRATNLLTNPIVYIGNVGLFATLNLSGVITSIADNLSGGITVTSTAHGLINGDFVNIIAAVEATYSQQRLVVSNITTNTFDVAILFTNSDTGTFDTGALSITFENILFTHPTPNFETLFDISFTADPTSLFFCDKVIASGIPFIGEVRFVSTFAVNFSQFVFSESGLSFDNCVNGTIDNCLFTCLNQTDPDIQCLIFISNTFRDVVILNTKFNLGASTQHAILIDPLIDQADFNITTCPDNQIITDYFDTMGLDQTDKQIITVNNGVRQDSENLAEVMSDVPLTVTGGLNAEVPVQNDTLVTDDFKLDSVSEGYTINTQTGVITVNTRANARARIEYALEVEASNPQKSLEYFLYINGVKQDKTIRTVITMGIGTVVPISYLGGYFMLGPTDTIQLRQKNTTDANSIAVTNVVYLIR